MSSTVVFTVAFGIAVDDTIHLLSRYYIERRKHRGMKDQLYFTFQHTGQSLIFTTIVLFFGFGSLIFSQFTSTYRIGMYTSLTLFAALLFDFLMVPVLIDIIFGQKSKNWPKSYFLYDISHFSPICGKIHLCRNTMLYASNFFDDRRERIDSAGFFGSFFLVCQKWAVWRYLLAFH